MRRIFHYSLAILKRLHITDLFTDRLYVKCLYYDVLGKRLNLITPRTYCEKIQWLKLNDRKEIYHQMADKCEAKKIVAEAIGKKYVVPLIGCWNSVEEIDFDLLPEKFVMKCTHDSGGIILCKNKSELSIDEVKKKLKKNLKRNFYMLGREWAYKSIKPRIIAEKYLETTEDIVDYKVFCFEGIPKLINVHLGRFHKHTQDFYDTDWNKIDVYQGIEPSKVILEKPEFLDEMIGLSEVLSKGMHHIRIDWYYVDNQLYFGEYTFYDSAGFDEFEPDEYNYLLGDWMQIEGHEILNSDV